MGSLVSTMAGYLLTSLSPDAAPRRGRLDVADPPRCSNPLCTIANTATLRFSRCRGAIYCSEQCQVADRPAHRLHCVELPPMAAAIAHAALPPLPPRAPLSINLHDLALAAAVAEWRRGQRTDADTAALTVAVSAALRAGARADVLVYDGAELSPAMPTLVNPRLLSLLQLAAAVAAGEHAGADPAGSEGARAEARADGAAPRAHGPPLRLNCLYPSSPARWVVSPAEAAAATGLTGSPSWCTPLGRLLLAAHRQEGDPAHDVDAFEAALRWAHAAGADFSLPGSLDDAAEGGAAGAPLPGWTDPAGRYRLPNLALPMQILVNTTVHPEGAREFHTVMRTELPPGERRTWRKRGQQAVDRLTRLVPVLAQLGADAAAPDFPVGMTALHHAMFGGRHHYAPGGAVAVAEALLAAGADPDATDSQSRRPVDIAAFQGQADVASRLLQASAERAVAAARAAADAGAAIAADAVCAAAVRPRCFLTVAGRPRTYLMAAIDADAADLLRAAQEAGVRLREQTVPLLGIGHLPLLAYAALRGSLECVTCLLALRGARRAVGVNQEFDVRLLPAGVAFRLDSRVADEARSINKELGPVATVVDRGDNRVRLPPPPADGEDPAVVPMTALQLVYYPMRYLQPTDAGDGTNVLRAFNARRRTIERRLVAMGGATINQLRPGTADAALAHEAHNRAAAVVLSGAGVQRRRRARAWYRAQRARRGPNNSEDTAPRHGAHPATTGSQVYDTYDTQC